MIEKIISYQNHDYTIWIGQNSQDNWDIIDNASDYDIWFHLEEFSSPHIILRMTEDTKLKTVSKWLLIECAIVCKQRSSQKKVNKVSIIYTNIKNVKKAEKVGSVITSNTLSLII
jgi:predicted ribosome quality control (RQC) complex YloA/Tae2 family protein